MSARTVGAAAIHLLTVKNWYESAFLVAETDGSAAPVPYLDTIEITVLFEIRVLRRYIGVNCNF